MTFFNSKLAVKLAVPAIGAAMVAFGSGTAAAEPQVIDLVQVPCQFLDVEQDQGYSSTKKADCDAINAKSGEARLAKSKTLKLKSGEYVFRVSNKNVPYELGFWIREKGYNWANPLHKLNKLSVSGGGLYEGKSQDYSVTLKPGEYVFSCPLNTTLDYNIIVEES
jgi:hypothetical protein